MNKTRKKFFRINKTRKTRTNHGGKIRWLRYNWVGDPGTPENNKQARFFNRILPNFFDLENGTELIQFLNTKGLNVNHGNISTKENLSKIAKILPDWIRGQYENSNINKVAVFANLKMVIDSLETQREDRKKENIAREEQANKPKEAQKGETKQLKKTKEEETEEKIRKAHLNYEVAIHSLLLTTKAVRDELKLLEGEAGVIRATNAKYQGPGKGPSLQAGAFASPGVKQQHIPLKQCLKCEEYQDKSMFSNIRWRGRPQDGPKGFNICKQCVTTLAKAGNVAVISDPTGGPKQGGFRKTRKSRKSRKTRKTRKSRKTRKRKTKIKQRKSHKRR
jgi:hypothetical protein